MYSERQLRRAAEKGGRWFGAALKLTQTKPPRDLPLGRLIHEGNDHIRTVEKIQSGLRPLTAVGGCGRWNGGRAANDRLIARRLSTWKMKVDQWKRWKTQIAEWKAGREAAQQGLASASAVVPNAAAPAFFVPNASAPAFVPSVALLPAPPAQAPPPPLPEAFTAAAEWFGTSKLRGLTNVVRPPRGNADANSIETLKYLACVGSRHLLAVNDSKSSWPRGSRSTMGRCFVKWQRVVHTWNVVSIEATIHALRANGDLTRSCIRDAEKKLVEGNSHVDETRQYLESSKPSWLRHRAKQRKKRTCSHCGTTAPFSARAFPYCGGCRHPKEGEPMVVVEADCVVGQLDVPADAMVVQPDAVLRLVPRVDRPRYCSEECQRAHWLAGHCNECPCHTGGG